MKTESGTKFYPFAGEYLVAAKEETLVCVQVESGQAVERGLGQEQVPLADQVGHFV